MKRIHIDHAEARSKPLAPDGAAPEREAQPRGARVRGSRPIDHAEAAECVLAAPDHVPFHDKRLWDLRGKRDRLPHDIDEWEQLLGVNAVGYLARRLLILLDPATIVESLHGAYERPEFDQGHYPVLPTGPSATADIEGVLIHGAQGVRALTVLLTPLR